MNEDFPENVIIDLNRLRQIVINILSNAIKYTIKGKVEMRAFLENDNKFSIQIEDTGVGIETE